MLYVHELMNSTSGITGSLDVNKHLAPWCSLVAAILSMAGVDLHSGVI